MQPPISTPTAAAFNAKTLFERIFVPIDFSEGSRRALVTALELKEQFDSEVHLFRLTESSENEQFLAGTGAGVSTGGLIEDAKARLQRFVDNVVPGRGRDVIVHAKVGTDVLHGIARTAKGVASTLVVVAEAPRQTVFRTQLEKLVRELDSAVLILRLPPEVPAS